MGTPNPISYEPNAVTIDLEFSESDRSQSLPVVNYASAIAKAVEWLGDRYLLAKPKEPVRYRRSNLRSRNEPAPKIGTFEMTRGSTPTQ